MKRLHFADGGRPLSNNDLSILQEEVYKAVEQQYSGLGSFIVSGCTVSATTIASGLVFIDGKILPFAGASSVTFPAYIKQAAVQDQDPVAYETGTTHPKRKLYSAELVSAQPAAGGYIVMSSTGGRSYYDAISSEVVRMRGNQTVAGTKTFESVIKANGDIQKTVDEKTVTLTTLQQEKADQTYVDAELAKKVDAAVGTTVSLSTVSGISHTIEVYKDQLGHCFLRGNITGWPSSTASAKVGVLPQGYRPLSDVVYIPAVYRSGTGHKMGFLEVYANGDIWLFNNGSDAIATSYTNVGVGHISYPTAV
jgi:hypothetical protein